MIKIHKIENVEPEKKEENIFSTGLAGWGMILSKLKRKQPEQMPQQIQQQKPAVLPKKDGWSI